MQNGNTDEPLPGNELDLPAATSQRGLVTPISSRAQPLSLDFKSQETSTDSDEINLLNYWHILLKRKWTVLGAVAIVMVTAFIATLLTTPIYRATASMQIDREATQVVQVGVVSAAGQGAGYEDFYQTQYELLKSRALSERVVGQLGLAESGELEALMPPSPWTKLKSMLSGEEDAEKVLAKSRADLPDRTRAAVGMFQGGIDIKPVRNSRLVEINYDSPDPMFSAKAANAVAEGFMASNLEHGFEASAYAKSYLEDRLQELKLKLEDSERTLVNFAQKEQIISTGGENGTLTEQNLGSINTAYSKAKEDRIRVEARWRQAQSASGTNLPADMLANSSIRPLQEMRSKLKAEYQDKLRLFKADYPTMLQLRGQIDELDKQIGAEVASIKGSIQAEYQAAKGQEDLLAAQLGGLKVDVLDLQGRSIQYNIYKRDVDTNRQLYDGLLQRYKEIGIAGGVTTNNVSIVDRAQGAYQFKPDMRRNLSMALLLGSILGVMLALGFEYLDDTLKAPDDIERELGLSVIGIVPKLKPPLTPALALDDPRSAFAEAYRSVRTALQFATDHGVPRCLLITSASPAEGKSTTALTLAKNFAQLGKRVLLIDADLRNPSLHRALELENTGGLSNILAGAAKPNDVLQTTSIPQLMFIASGPLPPNPAELLMGSKLLSLLTVAMEKYDQIIVDGPPIMGLADAAILGNVCAGTLLVVEAGETRIAMARNALKRLISTRSRVVGALLTKYTATHAAGGYGYGDYSYYEYGGATQAKLGKR